MNMICSLQSPHQRLFQVKTNNNCQAEDSYIFASMTGAEIKFIILKGTLYPQ